MALRLKLTLISLALFFSTLLDAKIRMLKVEGAISPATAHLITSQIEQANDQQLELLILQLDTPGGLLKSTRLVVKEILASKVPVMTWVAPDGSRAASAGTYILYASHIAAMAPVSHLGAATPVRIGGTPNKNDQPTGPPEEQEKPQDTLSRKATQDAIAYIRSLAELRERNPEWAELAVSQAATLSASQALEKGVINIIASDLSSLLTQADGYILSGNQHAPKQLQLSSHAVEVVEPDWRHHFLAFITNPEITYILFMLGIWGIIIEFYNPGIGVPGVTGAIALTLALFASQLLPLNSTGVVLVLLGIALMITEVLVPSFGIFGIGGSIAFATGSILLLDSDLAEFGIPLSLVLAVTLCSLLVFVGGGYLAIRAHRQPLTSSNETMIGASARAIEDFDQQGFGRVQVQGEIWKAQINEQSPPVKAEELEVQAIGVDRLVLQVARIRNAERA